MMRWNRWTQAFLLVGSLLLLCCGQACAQTPTISGISPTSGSVGMAVTITGTGFGSAQGTSTLSLNGTAAVVTNWTDSSIAAIVPTGATTGTFSVTVSGQGATSSAFTVTPLPSGWSDGDIGSVGSAGSASYANGVLTVVGGGAGVSGTADGLHFAYQSLSGDGTIIGRLASLQGTSTSKTAGIMIRESLNAPSTAVYAADYASYTHVFNRASTGSTASNQGYSYLASGLPYWVKITRSANTFTQYSSSDGVSWTQMGNGITITMAQNVYIGLGVSSGNTSSLATATFDNVSISTSSNPAPVISSLSATTGTIGSQIVLTGTGFGTSQAGSVVTLNNLPVTINSWSGTSIAISISSAATTGFLLVSVAPNMNDSNRVYFEVTAHPLPVSMLDQDIGPVGEFGSGTFVNGVYTITGSGTGVAGTADQFHFVYQPLSGDGTIVARVVGVQGGSTPEAGVMIRETLSPGATNGFPADYGPYILFIRRTTIGGSTSSAYDASNVVLPYWVKLVRSGNTFTGYKSTDGVNWPQLETGFTISMAQNVYIGLAVSSGSNSTLTTATFDNVSISSTSSPAPVITNVSATTGSIGSQVVITGTGFTDLQTESLVTLNGVPVTINSWSSTSITITIPSGATSGLLVVSVAPSMNNSNPVDFEVTTQPLPVSMLDQDVGAVGQFGSATFVNGVYTVKGSGTGVVGTTADQFHFVYQPLSGDGTIVARVLSVQGGASPEAGVMIRETLTPGATNAFPSSYGSYVLFIRRTTTGGSTSSAYDASGLALPYWVKLVRSGNTFTGYRSADGVNWTQLETGFTISMAANVYVGLAVSSGANSALTTATFDNVSISSASSPAPAITSVSATTGTIGSQIVITGTAFGGSQGNSQVLLSDVPVTVNLWSATSITITIPSGAISGYLGVELAPSMNASNAVNFTVTTQPLPSPWLDQDVGSVGVAGSSGYTSGTFTVHGAGAGMTGTADQFHFVYQSLSGDGMIAARVANVQGPFAPGGVMIRETLNAGATSVLAAHYESYIVMFERTTTGGSISPAQYDVSNAALPYWIRLVRSGNVFTGFGSADGLNWVQLGASQTVSMAQNVYLGLAVGSGNTTGLATAAFDNVSIVAGAVPTVAGITPNLGGFGTSVTITGNNFGSSQGTSSVTFNGSAATAIASWTNTQIIASVPSGATTGPVTVSVNAVSSSPTFTFTVIHPVITSLTPPAAQPGGTIVLAGSGFGPTQPDALGNSEVYFNGVQATVLAWSDTSVTVSVPATTTSGPVTLTEDGATSNGVSFTALEPLTVTSISSSLGSAGDTLTINGTGFGATQSNSTANFFGATASVVSWSDTQIVVTIPTDATTGPVGVGVAQEFVWGPTFNLTSTAQLTDSLSNQTSYTSELIGGRWVPLSVQGSGCSSCTLRGTISYTYDSNGNALTRTDELGRTTAYAYDSNGNVLSVSVPLGSGHYAVTSYTYNSLNEVLTSTDPLGNVTTNTYDSKGNLLTVTTPAPASGVSASVTQFAYNSLGELTAITDPLGNATTLTYTSAGLVSTVTDAQSHVTTYGYDAHGNRTSVTDALSHQTTFAYDSMDRLTTITYPDTTTTTFGYDYRGRRTSVTDQNGKTTSYTYDDADRLLTVTDAATNVTTYAYDTENNLASIKDANNHTTSFAYDAFGRVTQTTFPSSLTESYSYDAVGNLTSKTDRKGQYIAYTYDQLNRLMLKTYPDTTTVNYTYDNDSRLTQVSDPTGTYSFTFDNMGRLANTTTQYAFLTGRNFTTSYVYDAASNRTGFTDPESGSSTYAYDTLNRLQTLTPPSAISSGNFGFGYDALSRRTTLTRPNSVNTAYSYDNLSRLLSVTHAKSGTTLDGTAYAVDSVGNRTSLTPQPSGTASNFTYDSIYELTQVTQGSSTTESYSFDPVGNRLSSLGVSSYTNNSSNELTSTSTATYTYDNNGNTLTKVDSTGTTSYAWDYENRMTSVTLPGSGGTVSFKYDPFGRRIYKSSSSGTSIYAYDLQNLIEETNSSGAVVSRYTQGVKIDEPLAMLRSGTTSYYEADGLGSITSLTNTAGALAQTYTFDSFGKQTASSGSLTNPFQYTAREFDAETSLQFSRARYYDPNAGRFISEDPIGFRAGNNFYQYVLNDPLNSIDPLGLDTTVIIIYDTGVGGITYGSHAALLIDNGGNPILYDPAGMYGEKHHCGSGQACGDLDADASKYKKFHQDNGSTVKFFVFKTTPQEEKQIADRIDQLGGAAPFFCATSVSNALSGIGPFKNLKGSMFPGNLADQLNNILNPPKPSGGKK